MVSGGYPVSEIATIINAESSGTHDGKITTLLTDSRRITNAAEALFFALGGRRDGHDFILQTYQAGVRSFVVSTEEVRPLADANYLVVKDVLTALQKLAAWHREQFGLQVIGITGSNGKTIVKEWLYQLLSPEHHIVRSPKSYNSQIGVPLSIWNIRTGNDLGVFEAGISAAGEMEKLEKVIQPTIGVLTHIGSAHDEGFKDREEKLAEKLKLFKNCELLIVNAEEIAGKNNLLPGVKLFTWSRTSPAANLYIPVKNPEEHSCQLRGIINSNNIGCRLPFIDQASIVNGITCWATLLALGYEAEVIEQRLQRLNPISMRLELKTGTNNCSIIDDSYNSDVQSLEIALNFLGQQNQHEKRTLILSDIYQSGLQPAELYRQIAAFVQPAGLYRFIGVGEGLAAHKHLFAAVDSSFYKNTAALLSDIPHLHFRDETILIKGSRDFTFERISRALVRQAHETMLEINLNTLANNLNYYRSKLKPGVKLMAMVKAFSYGSGTFEIANLLQYQKADYLAVAYADEGVALRQAGIKMPIMVLNTEAAAFDKLTEFNLEPEIYSFTLLHQFSDYLQRHNLYQYPVHIKIDTGMRRLGFEPAEVMKLCNALKHNDQLQVTSVFSHLVASDAELHDEFTRLQISLFKEAYLQIENSLGRPVIKHIANSSAISRWPDAQFDMVRLGIGLYGIDSAVTETNALQLAATLKTNIAQIKQVKTGDTIGYNRKGVVAKDGRLATVRIGYADGYLRSFGNGVGHMLVNGQLAPTIGNISMDMCVLDITGIDAKEGDEVTVFNAELSIEELARQIGTIPYEILTNISQRVKRVYFYE